MDRVQCYTCGFSGEGPYNRSCDDLTDVIASLRNDTKWPTTEVKDTFIRTCPPGVQSCFGAAGIYDNNGQDPDFSAYYSV